MTHLMNPLPATPLAIASRHGVSIQAFNSECFCISLDAEALKRALQSSVARSELRRKREVQRHDGKTRRGINGAGWWALRHRVDAGRAL